jgi:cytochrome c peroxidase
MSPARRSALFALLVVALAGAPLVSAQTAPVRPDEPFEPAKLSLRRIAVPKPSNLADFVADEKAAVVLGKALFWDMQVGSDGMTACASCHFHAGADNRTRGQLNPGLLITNANGSSAADRTFQVGGPGHTLQRSDFPFHQLTNRDRRDSGVIRSSNDVVGSQGVDKTRFEGLDRSANGVRENVSEVVDYIFSWSGRNTRQVSPRNAPTVINAVYNRRNFWDGRAQSVFNGVNPFGPRDPGAFVWRAVNPVQPEKVQVRIDNASLASQATAPALSSFEMSSAGREFPELAIRLLTQRPLAGQKVHANDSVLGRYSRAAGGLAVATYAELVRAAFKREWWQASVPIRDDADEATKIRRREVAANAGLTNLDNENARGLFTRDFSDLTLMEANFSLFFGLAIQLYEATLVSDAAPIDRFAEGDTAALSPLQKQGLDLFVNKARCASCHSGPAFTAGAVGPEPENRLELTMLQPGKAGIYDDGYYHIGVRPAREDMGLGATDPFSLPLAEARLVSLPPARRAALTGYDEFFFQFPTDVPLGDGFFKTPTLRNVELTAPYFHNGGQGDLMQVIEFYNRGGDFVEFGVNEQIRPLGLTAQEKTALVAFLSALTDDRVRFNRAPFDHPQLFVPTGPANNAAGETFLELPATGAAGGPARPNFLE